MLAYTAPDSRVVFLCGPQFIRERRRRPTDAEVVIIHEVLHTLGLGENPPTAEEITSRVMRHCAP